MTILDRAVLVARADRGTGQALAAEALSSGAKRVHAGTRRRLAHPDGRVAFLTWDLTGVAQTRAAADRQGVDDPPPPLPGTGSEASLMVLASSMGEAMQGRVLGRLPWLGAAMSSGDRLDHRSGRVSSE